ncbi:unnamed protein product [Effrenium voratum]|uniref:Uncharacterized protein n=1 Tax=Effrenium voratum TaxID=2562239 RepID=A0AA36NKX3_9DINO|nr:unnamed protein product [Effrenium voratum]
MNVCSSDVLSRGDIPSDWDPRSPVPVGGAPGAMGNGQYKTSGVEDPVLMQARGRRLQQFKDESIAGDMKWDPRYTARCDFGDSPCGPEGFSWVLQAAVHEGKLARVPDAAFKTTALGVGTLEMMQMLDQTPLGYQTKELGLGLVQPRGWGWTLMASRAAGTWPQGRSAPRSACKCLNRFLVGGSGFTGTCRIYCQEGLLWDEVDPHLDSGRPVMVILCSPYRWEDGGEGKLHWVVLTGFVNGDRNWYWFVSNGSIPGFMHADTAKHLVNAAIGNPFKKGAYIAHRVFLIDW